MLLRHAARHARHLILHPALAVLALGASPAGAATPARGSPPVACADTPCIPPPALAAFEAGRWEEAAAAAARVNHADSLAFAARALLAEVMLAGSRRAPPAEIAQARRLAEQALALDPAHLEGRLQLATALGLQGRAASPLSAYTRRLPQRARALLESCVRDAPQEAWAHALLGGWHLEALRIGGPAAGRFLGASAVSGRAAFTRAARLDPNEPTIPLLFAASLIAADPVGAAADARALAAQAAAGQGGTAFQREMRRRAGQLLRALDSGSPVSAKALAESWL